MSMTASVNSTMTELAEIAPADSAVPQVTLLEVVAILTEPEKGVPLRILVAEDDADSAETLAMLLHLYGHEVEIARSGPVAVQVARDHPFDVVLLDIGLPGMSGYDVARQLHDHGGVKRPLIIAITGYGRDGDLRQSEKSGIDLHLVKPVPPGMLEGVLRRFSRLIHG